MLNKRFLILSGIILSASVMRLVPHPPNVTPIAAMALFGGVHFANKRTALLVPLAAMYSPTVTLLSWRPATAIRWPARLPAP